MPSFNKILQLLGLLAWLALPTTAFGQDQDFWLDTLKAGSFTASGSNPGAGLANVNGSGPAYWFYNSQWGSFLLRSNHSQGNVFAVDSTGRLGTYAPASNSKLAIHQQGNESYGLGYQPDQLRLHLGGATSRFSFLDAPDGNEIFSIHSSGAVGVGTGSDTIAAGYLMAVKGKMRTQAIGVGISTIPVSYLLAVDGKMLTDGIGVGTGTEAIPDSFLIAVKGKVIAEEIQVDMDYDWPDYVFEPSYRLKPLSEVKTFIGTKGHLPNMPSAQQVAQQGGIELGEMNARLLEKVEELTLYLIEAKKAREKLAGEVKTLQEKLSRK
jgi:hypothetical protein